MSNFLQHFKGSEVYQKTIDLVKWSFDMPMSSKVKSWNLGKTSELILIVFALLFADTTIIMLACCAYALLLIIGILYVCASWIPEIYKQILRLFKQI